MLVAICFAAIYLLTAWQYQYVQQATAANESANTTAANTNKTLITIVSVLIGVVISAINSIFAYVVVFLTNLKKYRTRTLYNSSYAGELAIVQFLNTAVILFLVK